MRLVGAGSELLERAAPADELGCCCGRLGRVAARVAPQLSITACLHLNHSMALASFSLSLLIQVHEAAAVVVERGGDAGDEWRPAAASMRAVDGQ